MYIATASRAPSRRERRRPASPGRGRGGGRGRRSRSGFLGLGNRRRPRKTWALVLATRSVGAWEAASLRKPRLVSWARPRQPIVGPIQLVPSWETAIAPPSIAVDPVGEETIAVSQATAIVGRPRSSPLLGSGLVDQAVRTQCGTSRGRPLGIPSASRAPYRWERRRPAPPPGRGRGGGRIYTCIYIYTALTKRSAVSPLTAQLNAEPAAEESAVAESL
jgi:hypothetical protein